MLNPCSASDSHEPTVLPHDHGDDDGDDDAADDDDDDDVLQAAQ